MSLEAALGAVESLLGEQTATDEPLLTRMARHVVFAGGKRLRPRVTLLSFAAAGGAADRIPRVVQAAAAFELVHTATLVHDDIIDASPLRRGKPALHTLHGVGHAIVAADFLFARAFALSARLDKDVIAATEMACVHLAEGQVLEQRLARSIDIDTATYLRVIGKKTAEPLRACAVIGAHIAGAAPEALAALGEYGFHLGLAFQIADDLLDIDSTLEETGKPVRHDASQGILTLPALLALPQSERKEFLERPEAFEGRLRDPKVLEETRAVAIEHAERSRAALKAVPAGPYRDELVALASAVVDRRN
jgi:geranylgeranyl pyrophosphate synthase